jgi:hypothetical protein
VLAAIALTPSAPVLVPDLAGAAADEVAAVRSAALIAAAELPGRWISVGVGAADQVIASETRGTYAGYGADVAVALSPDAASDPVALPLCALWTGWLRERAAPDARAEVRVYRAGSDAATAMRAGRALRSEIEAAGDPVGVLLVADGANTLSPSAPGGYDPDAVGVQADLDTALATGDPGALRQLSDAVVGRVAYQVLAGLVGPDRVAARMLCAAAPYGVGYFVGVWRAAPA